MKVGQLGKRRVRKLPARYVEGTNLTADDINEPSNFHYAITGKYSSKWKCAMESEYNSLTAQLDQYSV